MSIYFVFILYLIFIVWFTLLTPWSVVIRSKVNMETKIRWKPDLFKLVYTKLWSYCKIFCTCTWTILQLKCGLFFDKISHFEYYFTVYWQNITQVNIFKHFCAIFYTFDVKYETFQEPVLGTFVTGFRLCLYELNRNQLSGLPSLPLMFSHD